MKRALLVGIDYYAGFNSLKGCVNDADALYPLMARNEDDSPNLDSRLMTASDASTAVTRDTFVSALDDLFAPGCDFALLYFAGHGAPQNGDVALVTSDATDKTPGVRFSEILETIRSSSVKEVIVVLDCCFSGGATAVPALGGDGAILPPGLSVLTASRGDQVSMETASGRGAFSAYLEGALDGGAADVLGHVTVAGLYAYLSESFGAWEQRPTFKANIDRLHDLRTCEPGVPLPILRNLTGWFPAIDDVLALDPTYEPTAVPLGHANETTFSGLQKLRAAKLVDPVGEEHMYYAAMNSTGCALTPLGQHYWRLVKAGRI